MGGKNRGAERPAEKPNELKGRDTLPSEGPVNVSAAEALGKIRDVSAVPALIEVLKDENWDVQRLTAEELAKLERALAKIERKKPELLEYDTDILTRCLVKGLEDECSIKRKDTANMLGAVQFKKALPLLREVAENDPVEEVREAARKAIARLHEDTTEHRLVKGLKDKCSIKRKNAADMLGAVQFKKALPLLREVAENDPVEEVREAARKAIAQIGSWWRASPGVEDK